MNHTIRIACLYLLLFTTGCLDTSGSAPGPSAWIDAPLNGATLVVDQVVAIMGHTNFPTEQMYLTINGTPFVELAVTQTSESLWEGVGTWRPVAPGYYRLQVTTRSVQSQVVNVNVYTSDYYRSTYLTPTPTATLLPTQAITATQAPGVQMNFWAEGPGLIAGECTVLHWEVNYATQVTLGGEVVAQIGSRQVCPTETTGYVLRGEGPGGAQEQSLTITVTPLTSTPTARPPTSAPPTSAPPTTAAPADNTPPSLAGLSHTPDFIFDAQTCGATSALVVGRVSDPSGISKVEITYRVVRGGSVGAWRTLAAQHIEGKKYQVEIGPTQLASSLASYSGGMVEYYLRAWDGRANLLQSPIQKFEVKVCLI